MKMQNLQDLIVIVPFEHPYIGEKEWQMIMKKQITIDLLWQKIASLEEEFTKDACGALIKKSDFRKQTEYGWDIDIIKPLSKKGKLNILNMRPMHWKNILKKGESYPIYQSAVTAVGIININFEKYYKVNLELQKMINKL